MTATIKDRLLKRGELKYLADTLRNGDVSSIRDAVAERGTVKQKSILCGNAEFSIRDAIVDHYLRGEVLSSKLVGVAKEVLKERGLM